MRKQFLHGYNIKAKIYLLEQKHGLKFSVVSAYLHITLLPCINVTHLTPLVSENKTINMELNFLKASVLYTNL